MTEEVSSAESRYVDDAPSPYAVALVNEVLNEEIVKSLLLRDS